ncbi:cordon-bleu protein-like 1 isoform X1 [Varanus komodoensis]|nr:cordon-bleu protein-like 1 isoform X1 [Varanus komodoensis]
MDGQSCAPPPRLPLSGRKSKPKAPLPPSERKISDSSFDDSELTLFSMEQKENMIDRDIELSVVLPGDVIKSTTVNGSKPMMDLLVYLCAQYRLNPSSHTIDLISAEKKQIKFKPNTPIGMLPVDEVILKPKQMDKKKPTPVIPEQTVRVVVNYKKTQKTIVRVSPHVPLQELLETICSKCDFDPLHTVLLKAYQSRETLDLTKSLNELGLRELYAMDVSRATTPTGEFSLSSLQDSCQNSQNSDILKEKENKGFFGFFQRNKKKREQTASAPATPLLSKPRPAFVMRSNVIPKQYDSNTLPSEMPKKRRAPLPPMPTSQSVPQDLAQTQDKPAGCVVKSSSVDESDKGLSGIGIVRTGSLQLSGTSSVNSSLKRAKRKAPTPPPRKAQGQSDNSIGTGSESAESVHTEGTVKGNCSEALSSPGHVVDLTRTTVPSGASCSFESTSHDQSNIQQVSEEGSLLGNSDTPDESEVSHKSDIGSEYSLEEIDEKEEMHNDSADTALTAQESSTSLSAPEVPLDGHQTEPAPSASEPATDVGENAQNSDEENTEKMRADAKAQQTQILREKVTLDNGKPLGGLQLNANNGCSDATEERKLDVLEGRETNKLEALNCQVYQNHTSLNQEQTPQVLLAVHDQKQESSTVETVKTQDAAIQTIPSDNNLCQTESADPQGFQQLTHRSSTQTQKALLKNPPSGFLNRVHEAVGTMTEPDHQRQQSAHGRASPNGNQNQPFANDNHSLTQRVVKSPVSSPTKSYPLYWQESKPKPKPSNEITRDYIPKVGMTTYKIVPPKSLEVVNNWELENQEATCLHMSPKNELSQEFGTQTENLNISKSLKQTGPGFRHEVMLPENDPLAKTYSADNSIASFSDARTKKTEVEPSKPKIIAPLALSTENKSTPPATQAKPVILSPTAKPSNFYLQMQRRVSGHYVTSAIARSGSLSSSTQSEAKSVEPEKKVPSPDRTSFPFPRTVNVPSQLIEEKTENGLEKAEDVAPPVKTPVSPNSSPSQPSPFNPKTLRTFVLPQPYSSSRPSPFALAVSSAVRRSQSFSKTGTNTSRPLRQQTSLDLSSSVSSTEIKDLSPLQSPTAQPQQSVTEKKNNGGIHAQSKPAPPLSGHPTAAASERSLAVTLQRPDPEQIHQTLLAAIRSGEAAAKLRRVGPPSNTVAINGRASLGSSASLEARHSNH